MGAPHFLSARHIFYEKYSQNEAATMKKRFNHTLGQKRTKILDEDPRKKKKSGGQRKHPLVGAALKCAMKKVDAENLPADANSNANKNATSNADSVFNEQPAPKQRRKRKSFLPAIRQSTRSNTPRQSSGKATTVEIFDP